MSGKCIGDPIGITQNIGGRDTEHIDSLRDQPGVASPVAFRIIAHVVGNSVDLNRKPAAGTVEIDYQITNWMVIPKLFPKRALAQAIP